MEYTQNYALRKPGLNEYANVGDLNYNSDKIDSQMKKNQDVDGEVYDPTSTSANAYEAGDYVINPDDGLMYVCNGTTYGTWDATKWDHTTEFEEIQKAMASGGESELANLHDVDITNPTEGQVLTYDEQNDEWVNSDLPDADVTKEASGNPIELTDAASAPMVRCETEIQGSQDLHGYDKPWVGGAGKNKLPLTVDGIKSANTSGTWNGNAYTDHGVTFTVLTDNGGNVTGIKAENTANASIFFNLGSSTISAGDYILNGCPANGSDSTYFLYAQNTSGTYKDYGVGISISEASDISTQFTIAIRNGITCNFTFYPMIRLSTVSDATFEPYSNICPITAYTEGEIEVSDGDGNTTTHTTTFSQSIYQGNADFVGGGAECKWKVVDLGSLRWMYVSGLHLFYAKVPDSKYSGKGSLIGFGCVCSVYHSEPTKTWNHFANGDINIGSDTAGANYPCVNIKEDSFSNVPDFTTFITGQKLAYELATPTTTPVTPTNLPIKSLLGYNHIESSTGEMEVEYIAKAFSPITEIVDSQISALSKMMELMLTSAREATMTASANYTTGTLIVACGALYKATTAISSGASLVVGTNITPTTIAEELAALA